MTRKPGSSDSNAADTGIATIGEPREAAGKQRRSRLDSQTEKRAAILQAARLVFQRSGYDGASMNDIAIEAAVSKPTLYVYFDSKEKLFDALIDTMNASVPETVLELDASDPDLESQLVRCGVGLMVKITDPERIEMLRVVTGAAGQFPEVGQKFFAAGPGRGIEKLKTYLTAAAGRGWLKVTDPELAAYQLLDLVQSIHIRRMLFAVAPSPSRQEIERTVRAGVKVFLSAYRPGG